MNDEKGHKESEDAPEGKNAGNLSDAFIRSGLPVSEALKRIAEDFQRAGTDAFKSKRVRIAELFEDADAQHSRGDFMPVIQDLAELHNPVLDLIEVQEDAIRELRTANAHLAMIASQAQEQAAESARYSKFAIWITGLVGAAALIATVIQIFMMR